MVSSSPALCALLLALLGVTAGRAGLRACSVPDVLRHYRAVIFEDLQAAVRRTGPRAEGTATSARHLHFIDNNRRRERAGASCGAQKEHSILLSIASLGRTLRGAVSGGRRGALEKAAWTVAVRTEAVMRRHCWAPRQRSTRRPETPPAQRRGSRRRLLLRALDAVAACWEKLFALRAADAGGLLGRPAPPQPAPAPPPRPRSRRIDPTQPRGTGCAPARPIGPAPPPSPAGRPRLEES